MFYVFILHVYVFFFYIHTSIYLFASHAIFDSHPAFY
jgi:hypothetical protein